MISTVFPTHIPLERRPLRSIVAVFVWCAWGRLARAAMRAIVRTHIRRDIRQRTWEECVFVFVVGHCVHV